MPEPMYRAGEIVLVPLLSAWFRWRLEGLHHVPAEGPVLVAPNHISLFDPLAVAYFLNRCGRRARFLAKAELYRNPLLGFLFRSTRMIPVRRGTGDPRPVNQGVAALRSGQVVVIYPEGTVNRTGDPLPQPGKTGVARLTLVSGVPVIPMAVWGAQHVWQHRFRETLAFRRPIWVKAGPPLDFSEFEERRREEGAMREVTDTIMRELSVLVDDLRARYPKEWGHLRARGRAVWRPPRR